MKRAVMIAILIVVIFVLIVALVGGYIYLQFTQEPHIPDETYLKINLMGCIIDSDDAFFSQKLSIRDLWYHIKRAKIDRRIKGIILKISYLDAGFAKIEDIGRILTDFKKSGKKVHAYIEVGGLREYLLATFADKIYVFKGGILFLKGLSAHAVFLKNTLSKIGIKADFLNIGEYKTGPNIYTEDKLTPEHEESLQRLLDDIYESSLKTISKNRKIDYPVIKNLIEESPISNHRLLKAKLIDKIIYEDEVLEKIKTLYKITSFDTYKQTTSPMPYKGKNKIAVIFASGEIHHGNSNRKTLMGNNVMGAETVAKQLRWARKNPSVKAVVLRIDSPGGSGFASDFIRREAELLLKEKPLVISMSDLAASGGYMMALSSSKILALSQTITGSIGVYGGKFVLKGFYDMIGLKKEILKTSKYADMFSDYREFSKAEREKFIEFMKILYRTFVREVSKSRKLKIEAVEKIARGRVWTGKSAIGLKLIDEIGGISEAIDEAKKLAKIPPAERIGIKIYPRKKSFWDFVSSMFSTKIKVSEDISDKIMEKINLYKRSFPSMMIPYKIQIN